LQFEYAMSGKWLELLKQIAPGVTRAGVLRDPAITAGIGQFGVFQSVAQALGVEVRPINVRDSGEIERGVAAFAQSPNGGLIVTGSAPPLAGSFLAPLRCAAPCRSDARLTVRRSIERILFLHDVRDHASAHLNFH
jgi:hypothetical protein